jgi:uncharacterized protein with FMN-binding domain
MSSRFTPPNRISLGPKSPTQPHASTSFLISGVSMDRISGPHFIKRIAKLTLGTLFGFIVLVGFPTSLVADDLIEFLSGATEQGTILEIRKDAKNFDFQPNNASSTETKTYSYGEVHAVTYKGRRFVMTPKLAPASQPEPATKPESTSRQGPAAKTQSVSDDDTRTKAEVLALIDEAGRTPPDWFNSTPMNHPASLDLSWPIKSTGPWNEATNVGQYIWGRVNPNESRWRSGIKLVHECISVHQSDPERLDRDMDKLGDMYFTLLQDYARAAFWLQKGKATVDRPTGIYLSECYWRLGNKTMALERLKGRLLHFDAIKLLGDMGEIEGALTVAEYYGKSNVFNEAFLNAGDALRSAGRLDEAVAYYQKVLDRNQARNEEYLERFTARAAGAIEAIKLFDEADVNHVADGAYTDQSTGYNGKIEVQVNVVGSRIESVKVTQHQEKQFYAALTDTTSQIVAKQSVRDIDGTSGATITSQAIIHASARALAQGAK